MPRNTIDRSRTATSDTTVRSKSGQVAEFLEQARSVTPTPGRRGRLIFALDATMSRQPTWDSAIH
ncbi:MAG: VWA domain-containing protein, partial [Alphaproteobacteria bacterium]